MILVDTRAGSGPLVKPLQAAGVVDVEPVQLAFGDVAFQSKDKQWVGVEYKTLGDFLSCCRDGRLTGHQFRGMLDPTYKPATPGLRLKYAFVWLLVEGDWRIDAQGRLCTYQGPKRGWKSVPGNVSSSEFNKRLIGITLRLGVHYWRTLRREESVSFLVDLYRDSTDSAFDEHTSHIAPHILGGSTPMSPFREAVIAWPEVGVKVSLAAEKRFRHEGRPSVRNAASASVYDWADLTTKDKKGKSRRFGEIQAQKLVNFLN